MENSAVQIIQVNLPMVAVGKSFTGDYAASPVYAAEVQKILRASGTPFIPNKVIGVYYDNPETTPAESLRSFHGFFLEGKGHVIDPGLSKLSLKGKYLYTKVSGDPVKVIFDGYNALFSHIQENGIVLRSNAGYQISTYEDKTVTIEIYMEIL